LSQFLDRERWRGLVEHRVTVWANGTQVFYRIHVLRAALSEGREVVNVDKPFPNFTVALPEVETTNLAVCPPFLNASGAGIGIAFPPVDCDGLNSSLRVRLRAVLFGAEIYLTGVQRSLKGRVDIRTTVLTPFG
jgi:hypothetical protein